MVYAGAEVLPDGKVRLATGRYCEWKHKTVDLAEEVDTFEEYKATLRLQCDPGQPGTFYWTPDSDTPNTVYYQVGRAPSVYHTCFYCFYFKVDDSIC